MTVSSCCWRISPPSCRRPARSHPHHRRHDRRRPLTEWAEFVDVLARHPALAERMLMLPGNHDVNIVDRANPARLDLPFSPAKRLRQLRTLSAMAAVQGERVRVVDARETGAVTRWTLARRRTAQARSRRVCRRGGLRLSLGVARLWDELFPMLVPPDDEDGLGVVMLNSNAETHFSFTNALGLVSAEQARRLRPYDPALSGAHAGSSPCTIISSSIPTPVKAFSERIGTALVNGSWFVRKLRRSPVAPWRCTAIAISTGSAPAARSRSSRRPRRSWTRRDTADAFLHSHADGWACWTAWSAPAPARGDCRRETPIGGDWNCAALHSASFVNYITYPAGDRM